MTLYLTILCITFFAELPDKTSFAAFILSTQKKPLAVFTGGALAMVVHTLIAVAFGSLLSGLPSRPLHLLCGAVFLVFAVLMWRRKREDADESVQTEERPGGFLGTAMTAFLMIFAAEWGDLTQFSTAALAAKYHNPAIVFLGAVTGLWAAIGLSGWLGSKAGRAFNPALLQKLAATVFALVGIWSLLA